jgi:dTDP-glucose 4,6-dehydratase
MRNPLAQDLELALKLTPALRDDLSGSRIFITGGTGFFGGWLLESLIHAVDRGLDARATVLTRDPTTFCRMRPHLALHPAVKVLPGDLLTLAPSTDRFTHVIHAATEATGRLDPAKSQSNFDTIVEGTRRALAFARACKARRFLFASSGAVYGRQPPECAYLVEDYPGTPLPGEYDSKYGQGKRLAESLCLTAWNDGGPEPVLARAFSFAGPYLPLNAHYAIGNFVRDALEHGPIRVNGDGTPMRSFLYGADLAGWLWTLLANGQAGRAYNVGSERVVSIRELASLVARVLGSSFGVEVAGEPVEGNLPERYVPCTLRARQELGLRENWTLEQAVERMANCAHHVRSA